MHRECSLPHFSSWNRVSAILFAAIRTGLLGVLAVTAGCYGPVGDDPEAVGEDFVPEGNARDYHARGDDLGCTQHLPRVGRFRVTNLVGNTEQSVQVAESQEGGRYPVGTLLAGNPYEWMLKRGPGFSAETNDWEFLFVERTADETRVLQRGTTDVVGLAPQTCVSCHSAALPEFDFVCAQGHGCADNPGLAPFFSFLIAQDPRCRSGFESEL